MSNPEPTPTTAPARRRKNRWWIWFFAFIAVASVAVAVFMIWFNWRLQLTPEKLEAEMQRWKEHGPASYVLTFTRQIKSGAPEQFVVRVRKRKAIEVRLNGDLLRDEQNQPFPAGHERLQWYTMDKLLREIEIFLDQDARERRQVFNVATFDANTGALETYIRSDKVRDVHIRETAKVELLVE
jgi:hypothetical protein